MFDDEKVAATLEELDKAVLSAYPSLLADALAAMKAEVQEPATDILSRLAVIERQLAYLVLKLS